MKKILIFIIIIVYGGLFIYSNMIKDDNKDNLYISILEYASENNISEVNATYDIVNKITPGMNGKKVNVDASYKVMKELGYYDESKMVYEEITPQISIEDVKREAIYHGNENENKVSININVAWGEEYLPEMLEILDKYNVKVNFFVEGNWASKNGELLKLMAEKGHTIGNHSYSHADFKKISRSQMLEEMTKTNDILKQYTNAEIAYFAPPSGAYNQTAIDAVDELGMKMIMWSVDTIDWQKPSAEVIKKRVLDKVKNGSIILMHPTANTKEALEDIIIEINKKGLEIVSLDGLLN